METTKSSNSVASDVLHLGSQSKLSAEEIAKAVAHHNRHHHGVQQANAGTKSASSKKHK